MNLAGAGVALPEWFTPEIDTVVVAFPDVPGRLLGKRLTRDHFLEQVLAEGSSVCNYLLTADIEMNPLDGFDLANWDKGYGDFQVVVDAGTLRRIPWLPGTALVLGDLHHEDGQPVAEAPRTLLRRQLERLAGRGLSALVASELEFYLFHETYRSASEKRYAGLVPSSDYLIDYHLLQTSRDEQVLGRARNEMCAANIPVEGSKGEWGKGQHELNLRYAEAMEMADRHVVFKQGLKEIAAQEQRAVTFMAKPSTADAGSSCHIHTSLWDASRQRNRFADGDGQSELFRQFLGGLLAYSRELSLFSAPTINSYKRYQVASWAPTSIAWSFDNRTTGFRVVGRGPSLRIENRMPGADANPYLAYAATVAAGLKGIEQGLDCGEAFRGNAYVAEHLERLPASLSAAAELFAASELAREAFGDEVVAFYLQTARREVEACRREVTDWERARYFERI